MGSAILESIEIYHEEVLNIDHLKIAWSNGRKTDVRLEGRSSAFIKLALFEMCSLIESEERKNNI